MESAEQYRRKMHIQGLAARRAGGGGFGETLTRARATRSHARLCDSRPKPRLVSSLPQSQQRGPSRFRQPLDLPALFVLAEARRESTPGLPQQGGEGGGARSGERRRGLRACPCEQFPAKKWDMFGREHDARVSGGRGETVVARRVEIEGRVYGVRLGGASPSCVA